MKANNDDALVRWRLVLGAVAAEGFAGAATLGAEDLARDAALSWLYERDSALDGRDIRRTADLSPSRLSVPDWVNEVQRLFPKETFDRLLREAVETYNLHEIVANEDTLAKIEPSEALLRAILFTKHLMNERVLAMAREIVRKVVRELIARLGKEVRRGFAGTQLRRRTRMKQMRNFDPRGTVARNLAMYNPVERRLYISEPRFWSRRTSHNKRWQVIILVDESGSMMGSVIHAAVMASCLWGLPSMKTHLVIFDTEVVDLTPSIADPVETLMKIQLGGGTDIARAVKYAEGLVENPRRTVIVLITDLYEGGDSAVLVRQVKRLHEQGVRFLTLAALDQDAEPVYDRELGRRLVEVGAHVAAMTPAELVTYLKEILG